jgi:hypothetical protein
LQCDDALREDSLEWVEVAEYVVSEATPQTHRSRNDKRDNGFVKAKGSDDRCAGPKAPAGKQAHGIASVPGDIEDMRRNDG